MTLSSDKLEQLKNWCSRQSLKFGVLFGSQATGQAQPDSDVDLAIWPTRPVSTGERLRWVGELETLLNREVNLVWVSAELDPVLRDFAQFVSLFEQQLDKN